MNLDIFADSTIFILCILIFNATPIETSSSTERDMKAPDFKFNWRTIEDRENPPELFLTKAREGVLGGRGSRNREIFSVDLATS